MELDLIAPCWLVIDCLELLCDTYVHEPMRPLIVKKTKTSFPLVFKAPQFRLLGKLSPPLNLNADISDHWKVLFFVCNGCAPNLKCLLRDQRVSLREFFWALRHLLPLDQGRLKDMMSPG